MAESHQGIVVVLGDSCELGQATVNALRAAGFEALGVSRQSTQVRADVLTDSGLLLLDEALTAQPRPLKGVVNFIGCETGSGQPTEISDDDWEHTWRCNVLPVVRVARLLENKLQQDSRWINISSALARAPSAFSAHYSSAKAALESVSRSVALAWASRGVRVTTLRLGAIDTAKARHKQHFNLDRTLSRIALHELGTPDDVAKTIVFLLSPGSRWMTGHVLDLDGGTGLR